MQLQSQIAPKIIEAVATETGELKHIIGLSMKPFQVLELVPKEDYDRLLAEHRAASKNFLLAINKLTKK